MTHLHMTQILYFVVLIGSAKVAMNSFVVIAVSAFPLFCTTLNHFCHELWQFELYSTNFMSKCNFNELQFVQI